MWILAFLLDLDFGLSLLSYWFISVAPVRGRQKKAAQTANS
jgi:hypothetical protein